MPKPFPEINVSTELVLKYGSEPDNIIHSCLFQELLFFSFRQKNGFCGKNQLLPPW
jgi:hypothetical protein